MNSVKAGALLLFVLSVPRAFPQTAGVHFDVASVKAVDISTLGDTINMNIGTVRHEEVTFGNAT